jgi:hypothetical protein
MPEPQFPRISILICTSSLPGRGNTQLPNDKRGICCRQGRRMHWMQTERRRSIPRDGIAARALRHRRSDLEKTANASKATGSVPNPLRVASRAFCLIPSNAISSSTECRTHRQAMCLPSFTSVPNAIAPGSTPLTLFSAPTANFAVLRLATVRFRIASDGHRSGSPIFSRSI